MIRLLSSGILVGWDTATFWFLYLVAATLVANAVWFGIWALVEWHVPDSKKVKAAREVDRQTILALKEQLCDTLNELVRAQKSEKALSDVLEEMRSSNRNLNARASDVLKK